MVITTDSESEPLVGILARHAVAIQDHSEGARCYNKRMMMGENGQELLPAHEWQEETRFKGNDSDSRSFMRL